MNIAQAVLLSNMECHSLDTQTKHKKTKVHGLKVTVEHPRGTVRKLHDDTGKLMFQKRMHFDYGYFDKTKGRDGDEVDVFVGPMKTAKEVYIIHMKDLGPDKNAREDEDKCFVGFPSADAAKTAFLLHYPKDFYESMTAMPIEVFKKRLKHATLPHRRKKIHAKTMCSCGSTEFHAGKCKRCGKVIEEIDAVLKKGKGSMPYNIKKLMKEGKPQDQAVAIAYKQAGEKKVSAGGPGSGRHKTVGDIVQEHGYTKKITIPMWKMTTYTHPDTGNVIEHFATTKSWTHRNKDVTKVHGIGKGEDTLHEHMSKFAHGRTEPVKVIPHGPGAEHSVRSPMSKTYA